MTKDEALKLALEAFGEIEWSNNSQWQSDRAKVAITAIKEALAQPEQEPTVPATAYDRLFALNEANAARIIELEAAQTEQEPETCANCKHNEWPFGMCDGCPKQSDESQTGNWEAKSKQADSLSPALSDADMDKLATAVNQIDAGEKGWHHLMDVALSIAQQPAQQEPVAWGWAIMHSDGTYAWIRPRIADFFGSIQEREPYTSEDAKHADREWAGLAPHTIVTLYTSPPAQRKPMTDEQREEIAKKWRGRNWTVGDIIDAIEAAYGIGEKK